MAWLDVSFRCCRCSLWIYSHRTVLPECFTRLNTRSVSCADKTPIPHPSTSSLIFYFHVSFLDCDVMPYDLSAYFEHACVILRAYVFYDFVLGLWLHLQRSVFLWCYYLQGCCSSFSVLKHTTCEIIKKYLNTVFGSY